MLRIAVAFFGSFDVVVRRIHDWGLSRLSSTPHDTWSSSIVADSSPITHWRQSSMGIRDILREMQYDVSHIAQFGHGWCILTAHKRQDMETNESLLGSLSKSSFSSAVPSQCRLIVPKDTFSNVFTAIVHSHIKVILKLTKYCPTELPLKCIHCGVAFAQRSNLGTRQSSHHLKFMTPQEMYLH